MGRRLLDPTGRLTLVCYRMNRAVVLFSTIYFPNVPERDAGSRVKYAEVLHCVSGIGGAPYDSNQDAFEFSEASPCGRGLGVGLFDQLRRHIVRGSDFDVDFRGSSWPRSGWWPWSWSRCWSRPWPWRRLVSWPWSRSWILSWPWLWLWLHCSGLLLEPALWPDDLPVLRARSRHAGLQTNTRCAGSPSHLVSFEALIKISGSVPIRTSGSPPRAPQGEAPYRHRPPVHLALSTRSAG